MQQILTNRSLNQRVFFLFLQNSCKLQIFVYSLSNLTRVFIEYILYPQSDFRKGQIYSLLIDRKHNVERINTGAKKVSQLNE